MTSSVDFKFELSDQIVEKATNIPGVIVMRAEDHIGVMYECMFQIRTQGRRRHWKRQAEIKLAPPAPKPKPEPEPEGDDKPEDNEQ